jgi:hypothetical protein
LSSTSARVSGRGRSKGIPEPAELRLGGERRECSFGGPSARTLLGRCECCRNLPQAELRDEVHWTSGSIAHRGFSVAHRKQARLLTLAGPF